LQLHKSPGVARALVRALKVAYEDISQVRSAVDAVSWQVLQPGLCRVTEADWQVLNDEIVIAGSRRSAREVVVLQPDTGIDILIIPSDIVGRSEALGELRVSDPSSERLQPGGLGALAPVLIVVVSPTSAWVAPSRWFIPRAGDLLLAVLPVFACSLLLLVGAVPGVDGVSHVTIPNPLLDQGSLRLRDRLGYRAIILLVMMLLAVRR
jgi:hypothetical protein